MLSTPEALAARDPAGVDHGGIHHGRIAERVGPDGVRMSYPSYILEILAAFAKHRVSFAAFRTSFRSRSKKRWYDAKSGKSFNVNSLYQQGRGRLPTVQAIEERLHQHSKAAKISLRDMMDTVRDPLISGPDRVMAKSRICARMSRGITSTYSGWPQPIP